MKCLSHQGHHRNVWEFMKQELIYHTLKISYLFVRTHQFRNTQNHKLKISFSKIQHQFWFLWKSYTYRYCLKIFKICNLMIKWFKDYPIWISINNFIIDDMKFTIFSILYGKNVELRLGLQIVLIYSNAQLFYVYRWKNFGTFIFPILSFKLWILSRKFKMKFPNNFRIILLFFF